MRVRFVTPRRVIAVTVVVSLVSVGAIGSIGVQSYVAAQRSVAEEMRAVASEISANVENLTSASGEADALIASAQQALDGSSGKTFDNAARDQLNAAIAAAKAEREDARLRAQSLAELLIEAESTFDEQLLWPDTAERVVDRLVRANASVTTNLDAALERVSDAQTAVAEAQAAWQAEQDRIAAEAAKAAEEARATAAQAIAQRAKAASAGSTLKPSGGSTAPNVQQAPPPPAPTAPYSASAPTPTVFSAESFLRQYVSPAFASVTWNPNLCQPGYICGTTTVGRGTPVITMMRTADAPANYDWYGGKYVLVHEAAHAHQFRIYGSVAAMIAGAERGTSSMGITGVAAVEYMADCSTIVKIGFAGTYTSSCTPEQLTEAARVWN